MIADESSGRTWDIQSGQTIRGFVEDTQYVLRIPGASEVYVDDTPLTHRSSAGVFEWRPGFFAGRVAAYAYSGASLLASFELAIGPSEQKLGEMEFDGMVEALSSRWPALLLGNNGESGSFGTQGEHESEEVLYLRIRKALPDFLAAMDKVCQDPILRLVQTRHTVLPHRARMVDRTTVRELIKTRYGAQVLAGSRVTASPSPVSVPFTALSPDNPPNRHMAARLDFLQAATDRLIGVWSSRKSGTKDDDQSRKYPRRLEVLKEASARLSTLRKTPPFSTLQAAGISAAGLNAISAHPDYARANTAAWKALRQGILGGSADALPFSPTWQVYERWCFMRIAEELERRFHQAGWAARSPRKYVGKIGSATVILHLQPKFCAWGNGGAHEFRSLSREREPDIVLTVQSPTSSRFLVFDAKYRVTRYNVLDAMSSAHIYNDSLRWQGGRPCGSYLILPRSGQVDWLRDPTFREEHKLGTFALSPTCTDLDLWELISTFVSLAVEQ